jgi:MFS family permease
MRGVQGLGAAVVLPAALSIVMNMFSEGAERNRALSAWSGNGATAASVGLLGGGVLTRYAGWPYIFYLNVPIGAAALLLGQGHATTAALTGGFQCAFWVTGLAGLAAVPVTFLLIRRTELARAVAASLQREPSVAAAD